MNTLILMCGLPRSGKTTIAQQIAIAERAPIVNPDAVRLALHGQRFQALAEPFVWAIAKTMVRSLFNAGHPKVIVDATNTTRARRDEWKSSDWERQIVVVGTDPAVCTERARATGMEDLVPVIARMAEKWEAVEYEEGIAAYAGGMAP